MEKFAQLGADIAKLWSKYGTSHYLPGIRNTGKPGSCISS